MSQARSARWIDARLVALTASGHDGPVLTIEEIVAQDIFPFTGDLRVKPLEPRVIPAHRRFGWVSLPAARIIRSR